MRIRLAAAALALLTPGAGAATDVLILKDGRRLEGEITVSGPSRVRTGGAEIRLSEIASAEGGPARLRAALLLDAFLKEADDARAEALAAAIVALDLEPAEFAACAREDRATELPPPGIVERRVVVRHDRTEAAAHVVVPASAPRDGALAPLVVALHGTGGNGADVARFYAPLAERFGVVVACPTATFNRESGWGATDAERSLPRSLVRDLLAEMPIDPDRVYATGWSMGGHASWDLGLHDPSLFAALMPIVGGPFFRYYPLLSNLVSTPIYDIQGADDDPDLVAAQRLGVARLKALGARELVYRELEGRGHEFFDDLVPAGLEWLLAKKRDPLPKKIRFTTIHERSLSSAWVRIETLASDAWLPSRPLKVRTRAPKDEDAKQRMFREAMEAQAARIEASIDSPSRISVKTRGIDSYSLLLLDGLLDFDRDLWVNTNGRRSYSGRPQRDPRLLLRTLRATADRARLVWAEVTVDGPASGR